MGRPRMELSDSLVVFVDDPAVCARERDRASDNGGEHGLEVERRADGLAHLPEGSQLGDRLTQLARPGLELFEQVDILERNRGMISQAREEPDFIRREVVRLET